MSIVKDGLDGTQSAARESSGRFAPGNPGGPGRPPRTVEREYLAALGDVVSLADWREIVQRAVTDAKAGDATARAWITRHVVGEKLTLMDVAAREAARISVAAETAAEGQAAAWSATVKGINPIPASFSDDTAPVSERSRKKPPASRYNYRAHGSASKS